MKESKSFTIKGAANQNIDSSLNEPEMIADLVPHNVMPLCSKLDELDLNLLAGQVAFQFKDDLSLHTAPELNSCVHKSSFLTKKIRHNMMYPPSASWLADVSRFDEIFGMHHPYVMAQKKTKDKEKVTQKQLRSGPGLVMDLVKICRVEFPHRSFELLHKLCAARTDMELKNWNKTIEENKKLKSTKRGICKTAALSLK